MYAISWTEAALADFEDVIAAIGEENPYAAQRYADNFLSVLHGLIAHNPEIFRVWEVDRRARCCAMINPYLLLYSVDHSKQKIIVRRIVHGRRHSPGLDGE